MAPVLRLEPRWYYSHARRNQKGKNTQNNAASYVALATSYHPDWFTSTNFDGVILLQGLSLVPTWGMRRNISDKFNYEIGLGLGYGFTLENNKAKPDVVLNLHLRLGIVFGKKKQ